MPMHACSNCIRAEEVIACRSMISELVVGRSIAKRGELTAENLIEALDGVPPDQLRYPATKIAALRDALSHWN
jgi:hypothetical protein